MGKIRKTTYRVDTKEVIDRETGEYGKIEIAKKQKIAIDSEPFYMVFVDYVSPFFNLSNITSKNVLVWMCNRAEFNTGKISISSKDRTCMMEELKVKKSAISNAIKELSDKKLISGEKGSYIINPQIFWKGDLLTRNAMLDVKAIQVAFELELK